MPDFVKIEARKFAGFVFWGAFSYLLAFSFMYLLTQVIGVGNKVGYAITQIFILPINFLLNRYLVFASTSENMMRQGAKYLVVNVTMRCVDWLVFAFFETVLGWPYYAAIVCGMASAYPLKFLAYRVGVFGASTADGGQGEEGTASSADDYVPAQDKMALLPNYYRWMFRYFHDCIRGRVVELGCGQGHSIGLYLGKAEDVLAVDTNAELLKELETRLSSNKVRTARGDLNGSWDFVEDNSADTIVALDILEHLEDDREAAGRMAAKLREGGRVLVKVPAQSRLHGPVDEASGHLRRYDLDQLTALMENAGLTTEFCRHVNPFGALAYTLKRKHGTNLSRTFTRGQLKAINRLMPLISIFDAIPGLRGLSLVGVFVKPEHCCPGKSG